MGKKQDSLTAIFNELSPAIQARIVHLAESATVKQTNEQVLSTILHQGLKTLEKRRAKGAEERVERLEAKLALLKGRAA